jgi:hypothetical protein
MKLTPESRGLRQWLTRAVVWRGSDPTRLGVVATCSRMRFSQHYQWWCRGSKE